MNNLKIRIKLIENDMKYHQLDKLLGISEPTRCRMLRDELPADEQDRICKLIDEYTEKGGRENGH